MNGNDDRIKVFAKILKRRKWEGLLSFCTAILFCTLLLVACNGKGMELPTGTTPTPPRPTPFPSGNWTLEWTVRSSPDCLKELRPGSMRVYDMAVLLDQSPTITFIYDVRNWPTDAWEYTGTLTGKDFTAQAEDIFSLGCGLALQGTVSGSFSEDGRHLTATEIWTDRGNDKKYSFDWVATQK